MKSVSTLSAAIGERIRSLREEAGKTQSDLAKAGWRLGLGWTRSGVASIETGRRNLSIEDLLLLPLVLRYAGISKRDIQLSDLLPSDDVQVGLSKDFSVKSKHLKMSMSGRSNNMELDMDNPFGRDLRRVADRWNSADFVGAFRSSQERTKKLWPGASLSQMIKAERDMDGEAEQKAARRFQAAGLKVGPKDVSIAAHRLWGMGLTQKRDETVGSDLPGTSQAAARGHVTRKLLKEIEPIIKEVG